MSLSNAFPSVSPSLNLNFVRNNRLDPRITYSRSTTATYVGSDGYIKTAAINEPRFEYDPVSLAPRGLLLEGPRTNLTLYSQDMDNAYWNKPSSIVSANVAIAPDGTMTADKLIPTATTSTGISSSIVVGLNKTYTQSIYVKAGENSVFRMQMPADNFGSGSDRLVDFDLIALTMTGTGGTMTHVGNGWYRCTITATASTGSGNSSIQHYVRDNTTANGTDGLYIWGAQFEEAFFASSYIQTTSAEVTRAADDMEITDNNFIPWYNQAGGAFVISSDTFKADNTANTTYSRIFNLSDGSTDSRYTLFYNTTGGVSMAASGAGFTTSDSDSGVASKTVQKVGVNIEAGNSFLTHNGVQAGTTDTGAIVLNYMNQLYFFLYGTSSDEVNYGWGHIQYLLYYPEPLTLAQLQALTKQ